MSIQILISLLLQAALMVLLGYVLYLRRIITADFKKQLSSLLMDVILPISILASVNMPCSSQLLYGMGVTFVVSCLYYLIALVFVRRLSALLKLELPVQKLVTVISVFANTGFLGFPLANSLLGSEGMLYAVIYNISFNIFMFTYGKFLISGRTEVNVGKNLKDPSNVACLLSIVIFISPVRFPEVLQGTMDTLGSMMVPVSMLVIGCNLAQTSLKKVFCTPVAYLSSALRLVALPLLMLLALYFLQVPDTLALTIAMLTALPGGALNVIFAEQYDCRADLAALMVVHSMVFVIVTLPVYMILCSHLL